ncbi:snoRNA-binding rRNA-processing protein [Xylographa soralifera]|nr:snoRNA-binding rRNA-processing protein [Xylographa soralifera]
MAKEDTSSLSGSRQFRHQKPLADDLVTTGPSRTRSKKRKAHREDDARDTFVDSKSSRKILKIGQELAEEDQLASKPHAPNTAFTSESRFNASGSDNESLYDDAEEWGDEDNEIVDNVGVDPKDLDLFNKFIPSGEDPTLDLQVNSTQTEDQGTNLADLILEQIAAHEAAHAGNPTIHGGGHPDDAIELPAKVVEVYSKIGLILSRYKSGKLPKPFKIIPTLPQWEDLLAITRPESWTPNACYEATKIFVSSNPYVVRRFLESVILDRVREDIHDTKKLNVHLFNALQKATYKPAAFFKGFLFPLVNSGTCTLREAHIISGVLIRVSIPVLHSAAALMRLTEIAAEQTSVLTEGGGATNIFIRILLEKKYALPYKVIDNLVFHFLRFRATDPQSNDAAMSGVSGPGAKSLKLPVLWHQSLLAFAQRYRNDITEDQREALLDLLLVRGHKQIGPEVRRELLEGRGRGVVVEDFKNDGGDDTMIVDSV